METPPFLGVYRYLEWRLGIALLPSFVAPPYPILVSAR